MIRRNRMTVVVDDGLKQLLQYHVCRRAENEGLCDTMSTAAYKILWKYLRKTYPAEAKRLRKGLKK